MNTIPIIVIQPCQSIPTTHNPSQTYQHDGLPAWICDSCTSQLAISHNFRQQCIASVETLMALKIGGNSDGCVEVTKIEHKDEDEDVSKAQQINKHPL